VAVSFHSIHDHGFRVRAPIFFFSVPCSLMRAHFADDFVEPVRRQRRGMGPRLGARTYTRWLDTGVEKIRARDGRVRFGQAGLLKSQRRPGCRGLARRVAQRPSCRIVTRARLSSLRSSRRGFLANGFPLPGPPSGSLLFRGMSACV
jgi:hypothetical protein